MNSNNNEEDYNPTNILLACNWLKHIAWLHVSQLKLGDIQGHTPTDIPNFQTLHVHVSNMEKSA